MNLLVFLLRASGSMVAIAIITGFLSGISTAGLIALISHIISQQNALPVLLLIGAFVGLAGVALVTGILSQGVLIRLSNRAIFQLRLQLVQQILATDLQHLEQLGIPRLLATLTEDIQAVANAIALVPFLCIDAAIVIGSIAYITWLSWSALLLVGVLAGVAWITLSPLTSRGRKFLKRAREQEDHLFHHLRTTTEGIKELKLHYGRRQSFLKEDLEETALHLRRDNDRGLTAFAVLSNVGKLLFFFSAGIMLFALPRLVTVSPQTLAGSILTFTYLMLPINNLINALPMLSKANIALQTITALGLSLDSHAETEKTPTPIASRCHQLELQAVIYPYPGEEDRHFILGPINLTIHPGEILFVVGGNGSGKSTLAKLITGLYRPQEGTILLNQQPITPDNQEWYRQHFSAIYSDFYLFERLLGLDQPGIDAIAQNYLSKLHLQHKVKVEQGKLSTTALSQGQRKRLALLTAYLEDRPIYLFDEWAADQDPQFKDLFYTQLIPSLKAQGKTVLVISHDDRYFHCGDRLIKLENGQIVLEESVNRSLRSQETHPRQP